MLCVTWGELRAALPGAQLCSVSSRGTSPCAAERMGSPPLLFPQFLMRAGMLQQTVLGPMAVCTVLVWQLPQEPQLQGWDPSQQEKQNRVCVKSKN